MSKRRINRVPGGWTVFLVCATTMASAVAISAVGCEEQRPSLTPTWNEGGGSGTTTTTTATVDKGRQLFDGLVDEMMSACGACHDAGGLADTPFLREPRYESITSWPGMITKDPSESILLTYAMSGGGHSGTNLDSASLEGTLLPKIQEWLAEEAKAIGDVPPEQVGKSVDPFAPILGFNAVYLDTIDADFSGMAITFKANELTPSSLELTDIEVHTTSKQGIHMVHPLFSVYPKGGDPNPDPADSFSNVDQYIDYGQSEALGPGTLILANWVQEGKLQISFEKIETYSTMIPDGGTEGGLGGGCVALDSFTQNAQPSFGQCLGCHGGGNGQATAAVDMQGLVNDADVPNACAQIRNRVTPQNPADSQIFITTDPNEAAAHPYKFNQDQGAFDAFKSTVSVWIAAEQQ
jgi:mono/diheme cytochrome c family protein